MKKLVEFLIYIAGVVFFSWNYYKLKGALDVPSFLTFVVFYLFGVSKFATLASDKVDALIGSKRGRSEDDS